MSPQCPPDPLERDGFLFFWHGWPSNWTPAPFSLGGVGYGCVEQYLMAEKARLFGDAETLARILATPEPREQKSLGRRVRGFVEERWSRESREAVFRGSLARYQQRPADRALLLATGDLVLVEASPVDRIWGIGLAADDPAATDPRRWRGKNWLGYVLVKVRAELRHAPGPAV